MRTRNRSITFRVSEKELAAINRKAAREKLSRTDFLILAALGKQISQTEELKPILIVLSRIESDVGELTQAVNQSSVETVIPAAIEKITEQLSDVRVSLQKKLSEKG